MEARKHTTNPWWITLFVGQWIRIYFGFLGRTNARQRAKSATQKLGLHGA